MRTYAVPSGAVEVPIERTLDDDHLSPTVTLHPIDDTGFEVRDGEVVVGTLGAGRRADLDHIARHGFIPEVAARMRGDDIVLTLPQTAAAVPANHPPRAPWVLLPAGDTYAIGAYDGYRGPVQVLAVIAPGGEVSVDGEVVGKLDAAELGVDALAERDLVAVARGFIDDGTLTLTASPAADDAEISPLPALPPVPREDDTGFFATVDAEAASLAADTEAEPVEPAKSRGRITGRVVAAGAAVIALGITAVGTTMITSSWREDQGTVAQFPETVVTSGPTTTTSEEPTTEPTESTEPTEPTESTEPAAEPSEDAATTAPPAPAVRVPTPQQQLPAPAPTPAPAPVQAPAPAPRQQAPKQESHPYEYSIGGLRVRSNAPLDQPLYEMQP